MSETTKEKYEAAWYALHAAERYVSMVGSPYRGGGGGIGEVRTFRASTTLYYQETDGATNYHESSDSFENALGLACMNNAATLFAEALDILRERKRGAAAEFHAEMAAVAAEVTS